MAEVLTDFGEELILDEFQSSGFTLEIGLYADSNGPNGGSIGTTDSITDSTDINGVNTEPSGNYSRQNESIGNATVDLSGADAEIDIPNQNFDVTNSTREVNAYFIAISFDSDKAGDAGTPSNHLIQTGFLTESKNLDGTDSFELASAGGSLD